jgi:hypothetical protein
MRMLCMMRLHRILYQFRRDQAVPMRDEGDISSSPDQVNGLTVENFR